jgi:hypothetical protein
MHPKLYTIYMFMLLCNIFHRHCIYEGHIFTLCLRQWAIFLLFFYEQLSTLFEHFKNVVRGYVEKNSLKETVSVIKFYGWIQKGSVSYSKVQV